MATEEEAEGLGHVTWMTRVNGKYGARVHTRLERRGHGIHERLLDSQMEILVGLKLINISLAQRSKLKPQLGGI